jgi:peptide/nickel transport system ATP-binding protein
MAEAAPLVAVHDLARDFDVSRPWLDRALLGMPRQQLRAVDGVSFAIRRGETLALVGESGCGKSTVARLIAGLYTPSRGRIEFDGRDVSGSRALRGRMQMIFQDPYASLNPRWRVGRIVAEPLRMQALAASALRARVVALLDQVGLAAEDADKFPHQFSGGQRQRICIARALASHPELLLCDEPTSALDVSVQAQILNLMKSLQERAVLTYLFISHNLAVVAFIARRIGVMYLGRLVELADTAALLREPLHPYTRMLLDALPDLDMTGRPRTPVAGEVPNPLSPPPGCAFHPRCPHADRRCREERPQPTAVGPATAGAWVACHAVQEGRLPPRAAGATA